MGALGGMRRNVEVKARLRARAETLRAALRLRGLRQGCPGTGQGTGQGQEPGQVCPGTGHEPGHVCPGAGEGTGEGQEPCQVCPGAGQEPCQVCPGAGHEPCQVCPGAGQEPGQVCPGAGQILLQTDTFFRVPRGRLKLRRTQVRGGSGGCPCPHLSLSPPVPTCACPQDGRGELIFYERPDSAGPKLSRFRITPTADPEGLQEVLSLSLGVLGTVTKERVVLLLGQTRLHLDRVRGLGDFLELEVRGQCWRHPRGAVAPLGDVPGGGGTPG
uniref:CYTH domain-containing protein n=1 Tax=Cyanoderma ruficeps TaxID=181631 RepID=A0A8C3QLS4_9PASS